MDGWISMVDGWRVKQVKARKRQAACCTKQWKGRYLAVMWVGVNTLCRSVVVGT